MSLKIEINIPDYDYHGMKVQKSELLSEDMAALGFTRGHVLAVRYIDEETRTAFEADRAATLAPEIAENNGGAAQSEPAAPAEEAPKRRRGRPSKVEQEGEPKPNIPTGEERIDPAQGASDSEEDAAQDKADEAAEVERERKQPVTVDDIKALAVQYKDRFGMDAVQTDGAKIFEAALGAPPADTAGWRFAILPEEQDKLRLAFAAWSEALAKNPFHRSSV